MANPKGTVYILLAPKQESEVIIIHLIILEFSSKVTAYKKSYPSMP